MIKKPTIYIPASKDPDKPMAFSEEQAKSICEFGGLKYTLELHHNLDRIASQYLVNRAQFSNGASYADLRKHNTKFLKKIDDLLQFIDNSEEINVYHQAFIEGTLNFWDDQVNFQSFNKTLTSLKQGSEFIFSQKAKRDKNYAFINFIHFMAELFIHSGGNKSDFPTGISKLVENSKNDAKEYDSLFVDFIEQTLTAINEQLTQDKLEISDKYSADQLAQLNSWYENIDIPNTQSLAKKIQRALADKPLQ